MPRQRRLIWRLAAFAAIVLSLAVQQQSTAPAALAASPTAIGCTEAALDSAASAGGSYLFNCSGTITLSQPLTIQSGAALTLDGTGQQVSLNGSNKTRLFDVEGGTLALSSLTLYNGVAPWSQSAANGTNGAAGQVGIAGTNGADGAAGSGASGSPGTGGAPGTAGAPGGTGTDGTAAQGGAMFIAAGSVVTIDNSTIEGSTATGQQAGDGGSSAVLVNASYYIGTGSIGPAAAAGNGSVMFQWTVPGGPTATATSTPTSTPTATPSPTATASPIASPTAQSTITLTTVLSSLGTNYDIVLGFDASTGGAESYFTSSSMQAFNTLTTLQPLRGYWVHLTTDATWSLTGTALPAGTTLTLTPGWNLVGYTGTASEPIATALSHLNNQVDIVLGFDAGQGGALSYFTAANMAPFNNLTTLQPNAGYWLHMTGSGQQWSGQ